MDRSNQAIIISALLLALGSVSFGCGSGGGMGRESHTPEHLAFISIDIVASDPLGLSIEGVEVQIIGGWQESNDLSYHAPTPAYRGFTNSLGFVTFEAEDLAAAQVGFIEDEDGRAVLLHEFTENEAIVTLRIGAVSLGWIEVDVHVSHAEAHAHVFIEFDIS